jgi:hypothetical protein
MLGFIEHTSGRSKGERNISVDSMERLAEAVHKELWEMLKS